MALPAMAGERIVFATDWKAQAEHGGFYQAVANGLYKKAGLDPDKPPATWDAMVSACAALKKANREAAERRRAIHDMQAELDLETADKVVIDEMLERMFHACERLRAVGTMHDDLGHHGVVERRHHATLADAHKTAKGYSQQDYHRLFVELIDVPTDKAGILDLLRGYSVESSFQPVKTWGLTPRGALTEAENREI